MNKFELGDEVFVRDPQRYSKDCISITGVISGSQPIGSAMKYQVDATICKPYPTPYVNKQLWIHSVDLGHQMGIPLSQVTGADLDRMGREWRGEND